jgi:serine/threonine protein phosphatase PrpC
LADIPLTRRGPDHGGNFEFDWSGNGLEAHLISDVGKRREHNEDSCLMCVPEDVGQAANRGLLFAVADGMGGASAGEHASRLALERLAESYYAGADRPLPELLHTGVTTANRSVFEEATANPAYFGMGTTLSCLSIRGDGVYVASVGDSRVYLARKGAPVVQITDDHSLVAEQVRNGIISEEEAREHSLKNLITRAVGIRDNVEIDLFATRLQKGDTLLLCSDGLCNLVGEREINDAMHLDTLEHAARVLVGRALESGGQDNISVVLVRLVKQPPRCELDEGAQPVTYPETPTPATGWKSRIRRWFG